MREDLGLNPKQRAELTQTLNIVINCAANIELDEKLDISVKVNVTGPLNLLKLANESPNRCCFV